MAKHIILGFGVVLLLLSITIVTRALLFGTHQMSVDLIENIRIDQHANAKRLGDALSFKTISMTSGSDTTEEFLKFRKFLETTFPRTHSELRHESVNEHSLLYTWQGSDAGLKPALILAHMDVVPTKQDTITNWTHPPFAGVVADGHVWGRGALDMKQSLMAVMEAVEHLIEKGFKPNRTIYLAFGHDEEIGGFDGAAKIAELLRAREVQLEFTLDEGSGIVEGILPNITEPIALIGLAEKGSVTLELTAHGEGGHSSMPPKHTTVGKLAHAIHLLDTHQMPAKITPPFADMFEYLAPEMPFLQRLVVANRWLFNSLMISRLEKSRATNAAIRSTTAITMLKGSPAHNVSPTVATAVGNFRILPGDTVDTMVEHVRRIVRETDIIVNKIKTAVEPSSVSAIDSFGYNTINKTIRQVLPGTIVAPSLVVTGTDSTHYETISDNNYRFVPMRIGPEDIKRIHGIDERISIENYSEIVRFYIQFLRNSASSK